MPESASPASGSRRPTSSTADAGDYGNHDLGDRPRRPEDRLHRHPRHRGHLGHARSTWSRTRRTSSWHYTLRSTDGHIAQHVQTKDVAWHAGNWYVNTQVDRHRARGLRRAEGAPGTPRRCTARRPSWCGTSRDKYDIPLDRAAHHRPRQRAGHRPADRAGHALGPGPVLGLEPLLRPAAARRSSAFGAPAGRARSRSTPTTPPTSRSSPAATARPDEPVPAARLGVGAAAHRAGATDAPLIKDIGLHPAGEPTPRCTIVRPRRPGRRRPALRRRGPAGRLDRDLVPRPEGLVLQPGRRSRPP